MEYDSARAFERAGASVVTKVFKNLSAEDIRDSVEEFEKAINEARTDHHVPRRLLRRRRTWTAAPNSLPPPSRMRRLRKRSMKLVNERDGLCLGICNGFQALIKLGLVPFGEIAGQTADSPTLTFNTVNRHISKMVYTKVVSNKSPYWLAARSWARPM